MYRTALRHSASRPIIHSLRSTPRAPCRFASTASPAQSRSWRSSAARWGLAVAAVYYYNVSSTFADDSSSQSLDPSIPYGDMPTVDSVVQRRRESAKPTATEKPAESKPESEEAPTQDQTVAAQGLPAEEAGQDGAFNPETGEINWDCPCLGGMAHGPCGEDFKTAFSCFVYSTEEPKGMDCIEKFQSMQECFRKYPDIYGAELDDAESEAAEPAAESEPVQSLDPVEPASTTEKTEAPVAEFQTLREAHPAESETPKESPAVKPAKDAADAKPWTDTTAANEGRDEKR